jgi:hypothetical protein
MNNPLIDPKQIGKSIPERNNERRRRDEDIVQSASKQIQQQIQQIQQPRQHNPTNKSSSRVLLDDWDYLLYGTEEEYEAHFEPDKKKARRGRNMCFLLMLLGGLIMTASSCVCAVYVGLTYQDVHKSYTSMQVMTNPFEGINATDIDFMKEQMKGINHCISERYCKRIKEEEETEETEERYENEKNKFA